MRPSGENSNTKGRTAINLSALFRPIILTLLLACVIVSPDGLAFFGKKPEEKAPTTKSTKQSQEKSEEKSKEKPKGKSNDKSEAKPKNPEDKAKSSKPPKPSATPPRANKSAPNDPESRADAALEASEYREAAKLYADLAKQAEHAKSWYAASTYLLKETTCFIQLGEFKNGEDSIRRSLTFLENARCTNPLIQGQHLGALASCLRRQSKRREAETVYKDALSQLAQGSELSTYYMAEHAHELGICLAHEGKLEESEKQYRTSIDYFKRLTLSERKRIANPILSLAIYLNGEGRDLEAEQACLEGLKIGNEWGFDRPEHLAQYKCQLAIALCDRSDRWDAAMSSIEEAMQIGERAEGDIDWVFDMYHSWADALIGIKRFELAREWLDKGIALAQRRDEPNTHQVTTLLRDKARCEIGLGNLDEALGIINEATQRCAREKVLSDCAMQNASILGIIYHKQKKWDSELITLNRLYEMQMQKYGNHEHPVVVSTMRRLGNVLFQTGKYEAADRYFKKALAIDEKKKGKDNLSLAEFVQEIGTTYCITGKYIEAVPYLLRAIAIHDKNGDFSKGQFGLYGCLDELAYCYIAMNQPEKARPIIDRLFYLQDKGDGPANGIDAVATLQSLAGVHIRQGQTDEGKKLLNRVAELRKTEKWKRDANDDKKSSIPLYTIK